MLSIGYASVCLELTVLFFPCVFLSDFGFQGIDDRLSKIGILFEML